MWQKRFPAWLQLTMLTAIAFALRCYVASLDPYLHMWDERFHALVARNMMDNPFVPLMHKYQLLPYDYKLWCCNTVWLHKQPLFMWQMALSMKLFGVSTFTLRLPSIIMGTLMVPMIYSICRLLRTNHFTGMLAAAMYCCCYYHLELVAGYYGMDHDDIAFSFYVLASIWAYAHYTKNRTWKWVLLIGLFAGCAILCKWLAGLLIYVGWGIAILASLRKENFWKESGRMLCSLLATTVVALPWQLYILSRFPQEARYEFAYNARHLSEAVEGHKGEWDYYFDFFPQYFGDTICWLIPAGLLLMLFAKQLSRPLRFALCGMFLFAALFYSFVAQTKIYAYFVPLLPIGFIAIACCADRILELIRRFAVIRVVLSVAVVIIFCNVALQWGKIQIDHNDERPERIAVTKRTEVYRHLKQYLRPGTSVVVNMPEWEDVDLMFFNNNLIAHSWAPGPEDFAIYMKRGLIVAYFPENDSGRVPDYIKKYTGAYMLPVRIK